MKRYRILKDVEVAYGVTVRAGAIVEVKNINCLPTPRDTFRNMEEERCRTCSACEAKYCVCGEIKEPESQEDYEEQLNKYSHTVEPQEKEMSPQKKAYYESLRKGDYEDCSHKNVVAWCGDCENVVSPKEKEQLKPSTKIINLRWQNYPDSVGEYKALEATVCAIMDFLDSVAEGKYKL